MNDKDFQQLNIVLREHDKVWSYCVYHKDTIRPNLSISLLDKYYGKWKCWACGKEGKLSKNQMSELNLSNTIYKNSRRNLQTRWKEFNESCYDNLQRFPLLKLGLAKQLNISTKSLDEWLVGYDGISFTVPMFREDLPEYFRQDGFCGVQRRFSDGTKRCITGSHLGLMYPYDKINNCYIFICEGFSDAISIWDLGLQSIARPHCRHVDGIKEFLSEVMGGIELIIIIPDNDTVGREGAEKLRDELDGLYYDNDWEGGEVEVTIFPLPLFNNAKDIRDYIQLEGKQQVRKELLNSIIYLR